MNLTYSLASFTPMAQHANDRSDTPFEDEVGNPQEFGQLLGLMGENHSGVLPGYSQRAPADEIFVANGLLPQASEGQAEAPSNPNEGAHVGMQVADMLAATGAVTRQQDVSTLSTAPARTELSNRPLRGQTQSGAALAADDIEHHENQESDLEQIGSEPQAQAPTLIQDAPSRAQSAVIEPAADDAFVEEIQTPYIEQRVSHTAPVLNHSQAVSAYSQQNLNGQSKAPMPDSRDRMQASENVSLESPDASEHPEKLVVQEQRIQTTEDEKSAEEDAFVAREEAREAENLAREQAEASFRAALWSAPYFGATTGGASQENSSDLNAQSTIDAPQRLQQQSLDESSEPVEARFRPPVENKPFPVEPAQKTLHVPDEWTAVDDEVPKESLSLGAVVAPSQPQRMDSTREAHAPLVPQVLSRSDVRDASGGLVQKPALVEARQLDDVLQNQGPSHQETPSPATIAPQVFSTELTQSITEQTDLAAGSHASTISGSEVPQTLAQSIGQGFGTVRLRVQPEGLGELDVRMRVIRGQVRLNITGEEPELSKLIEQGMANLKEALGHHHLELGEVHFSAEEAPSDGTGQQNHRPNEDSHAQDRPQNPGAQRAQYYTPSTSVGSMPIAQAVANKHRVVDVVL